MSQILPELLMRRSFPSKYLGNLSSECTLFSLSPLCAGWASSCSHQRPESFIIAMDDQMTSNGHEDAFDDFSPSMPSENPPEMAGDGTAVWEETPMSSRTLTPIQMMTNSTTGYWSSNTRNQLEKMEDHLLVQMAGKMIRQMSNTMWILLSTKHVDTSGSKPRQTSRYSA